jgi:hypothetical protein
MNCKHCQALLDSYVEADLDQSVAIDVGAHVAMCVACGRCYEALLCEQATLRQYLNEIDAAPDLWEKVDDGIAQINSGSKGVFINGWFERQFAALHTLVPMRVAFTAVVALAIIGITFKTLHPVRDNGASDTLEESRPPNNSVREMATSDKKQRPKVQAAIRRRPATDAKPELRASNTDAIRIAEQQYSAAIAQLSRDFVHHRKRLNQTTVEQFEQTLAKLDVTIAATRRAAYEDPGNAHAVQYLMTAYARKVDALRQIVAA